MKTYTYMIVGGGMCGDAALKELRKRDPEARKAMFTTEPHYPYDRPPLSKDLWTGGKKERDIYRNTKPDDTTEVHTGRHIVAINPKEKAIRDDDGETYAYEKLLLATGGSPRQLDTDAKGIVYFRTLDDFHTLRGMADNGGRFAVIGGGFIGAELAAALRMSGCDVVMMFPETAIGAGRFPDGLGAHLNEYYREKGISVCTEDKPVEIRQDGPTWYIRSREGQEIEVNGVVAGLGITPNTALADLAGAEVDNGIKVDASLQTSVPGIFAAGDAAAWYQPALDEYVRVEHEDNALTMGQTAGASMAGDDVKYDHLSMFYSDLFDLGYEAVGQLDAAGCETVEDWQEHGKKGVVYYLGDQRVRGVLLWNVWDRVDDARELIRDTGPHSRESLTSSPPIPADG